MGKKRERIYTYEVRVPFPQVLVYYVQARTGIEAIRACKEGRIVEDHSLGGEISEASAKRVHKFVPGPGQSETTHVDDGDQ